MKTEHSTAVRILNHWQKKLRLLDWTIVLHENTFPEDFHDSNKYGEVEYNESLKAAVIRIISPDCCGSRMLPFNFEKTLVHELLHIKFSLLDNSDNPIQNRIVHQLVDELSRIVTENN